jgi:hypothetical protein
MDIPAYKILMGCDGKNLAETAELYSLTKVESKIIYSTRSAATPCFSPVQSVC